MNAQGESDAINAQRKLERDEHLSACRRTHTHGAKHMVLDGRLQGFDVLATDGGLWRIVWDAEHDEFDAEARAVDLIDALALDTTIEAAGGDEVHHHPILVKAQRLATRARAFVRSLNRSTHPKEGTP